LGWDIPVDLYCERIDATFWSEPLNALTNAAFIMAACAAALRYRAAEVCDWFVQCLIGVVALIGIGSFAFHTLATRGAVLLDVIPITIFIYAYLALALRRFVSVGPIATTVLLAAFSAFSYGLSVLVPHAWLNGSIDYLPPLAALYAIGLWPQNPEVRRGVLMAAVLFTASLVLRTADLAVCRAFPAGTHFLWHMLNAGVLYVLLVTAIDLRPAANKRA
jgi:hypothetical protein